MRPPCLHAVSSMRRFGLHRRRIACVLATVVAAFAAAPAGAVVGGRPVSPVDVPYFVAFETCGGTLVAPDRVVTAAHCLFGPLTDLGSARVGSAVRRPLRFALFPGWRRANGESRLDDIAVVQLDRPVPGVPAVGLGGPPGSVGRILGRGRAVPPDRPGPDEPRRRVLREALLRPIDDPACDRAYRGKRGNGNERFFAGRMICAIDRDGRAPLSSGCNGDSGGPLLVGPAAAPRLIGVVSWGGEGCGTDRLPTVFAEVERYRSFILDPTPTWAPTARSAPVVAGVPRPGRRLTCSGPRYSPRPDRVEVRWVRLDDPGERVVGRGRSYLVRRGDAGATLLCLVEAGNRGGPGIAPFSPRSLVRIAP